MVPKALRSFQGLSVRAVHSACDVGQPGYCPQDKRKECTAPLPFTTFPVSRAAPSAGVTAGELRPGVQGAALSARSQMSAADRQWVAAPVPGAFDLVGMSGPEYLFTALVKDYQPLATLGARYATAQVLVREQELPRESRRADTDGPGGTRFENYGKTEVYFRCPAELVEREVVRGPFRRKQ